MANPHKGEVSFTVGEGESAKTLKLSLSANAYCEIEEACGIDPERIEKMMRDPEKQMIGLSDLRKIFWQALRDQQPEITLDDTKAILKQMSPNQMGTLIGQAFISSMPAAAPEGTKNPPQPDSPPDGTGPASSTPG